VLTDRIGACGLVVTAGDLARFIPVYTYEFADEHAQQLATLPPGFRPAPRTAGTESRREDSRYERRLLDTAVGGSGKG
jgi:hypothetical protein